MIAYESSKALSSTLISLSLIKIRPSSTKIPLNLKLILYLLIEKFELCKMIQVII